MGSDSGVRVKDRLRAVWKFCLSLLKSDWEISDYPLVIREHEIDPNYAGTRLEQHRYTASVVNWWAVTGGGDTAREALQELEKAFAAVATRILVLCFLVSLCAGQRGYPLQPRTLTSTAPRVVQVPLFSFYAETQCDRDGNLFFHTDSGLYSRTEILRISSDGEEGQKFLLSGKFADPAEASYTNFSVTPNGDLYVLAWGLRTSKAYVFRFDDDGTMKNPGTLDVPENVVPWDLVAFDDQSVLFTGYYDEKAPKRLSGKQYAALFDATGKLRKELNLSLPDVDLASVGEKVREGGAARSEDGMLYFLGPKDVIVATPSGEVLRRISFNKPDTKSLASNIRASGSLISIGFLTFDTKGNVVNKDFLVLDATTGEPFGLYRPAPELGTDEACFSSNEGYTFVETAKGHYNIFKAALR